MKKNQTKKTIFSYVSLGIFICAVINEHGKRVLKASGIYKADDNMLHIVKLSKYPYYMWCRLGDISP